MLLGDKKALRKLRHLNVTLEMAGTFVGLFFGAAALAGCLLALWDENRPDVQAARFLSKVSVALFAIAGVSIFWRALQLDSAEKRFRLLAGLVLGFVLFAGDVVAVTYLEINLRGAWCVAVFVIHAVIGFGLIGIFMMARAFVAVDVSGGRVSRYHDNRTPASDPVVISPSRQKLARLEPQLFGWRALFMRISWGRRTLRAGPARQMIAERLLVGDSRAAVVASVSPLVVAAYTDEMDCVALLRFPDWLVAQEKLKIGTRLLTVNTYGKMPTLQRDLNNGPASHRRWTFLNPIIAEFVSDNMAVINDRKRRIAHAEWERTTLLAKARLREPAPLVRDGRPLRSHLTGTSLELRR